MKSNQSFLVYYCLCLSFMSILSETTWDLTSKTLTWENNSEIYWYSKLNYTQNTINTYGLSLAPNQNQSYTPGTFYIFSQNQSQSLPNIYISTNCTSTSACPAENYSSTPSESHHCWNANGTQIWWMTNQETLLQCFYYFTIPECGANCSIFFAFMPQLTIYSNTNIDIQIPWNNPAPMYFNYKIFDNFTQINGTNGTFIGILPELDNSIVREIFLGSTDPNFGGSACDYVFPSDSNTCNFSQFTYQSNDYSFLYIKFQYQNPKAKIIINLIANSQQNSLVFQSETLFACQQGYVPVNNTCAQVSYSIITNATAQTFSSNQQFWNQSLAQQNQGKQLIFNLQLTKTNFPGTFYLISQNQLPQVYISTDCTTVSACQVSVISTPQPNDYCFIQETSANSFYMNNLPLNSTNNTCNYYFDFPEANQNNDISMLYLPIESMTDATQQQPVILVDSSTQSLPRFIIYQLPQNYSTINQSLVSSYTITISNVDGDLIQNLFISSDDQIAKNASCSFSYFPSDVNNCYSMLQSAKETITGNYWSYNFLLSSLASGAYLGFYSQLNAVGTLQLQISSTVNCIKGYQYSETQKLCLQQQDCPATQYYDLTQTKCVNCSASLQYCTACINSNVCTECDQTHILSFGICTLPCNNGFLNKTATGIQCVNCMANCVQCADASSCQSCAQTYFWDIKSNTCRNSTFVIHTELQGNQGVFYFTLNATGEQQIFSVDIPQAYFPGAFYWVQAQIYPKVYVNTNCTANTSCNWDGSDPAPNNYCYTTPDDNNTAWSLPTLAGGLQSTCRLNFYFQADIQTNQTISFQYWSLAILNDGVNTISYPWEPMLPRYFAYTFPSQYSLITNATFYMQFNDLDETKIQSLYFGQNGDNQCNYMLPNEKNSCVTVQISGFQSLTFAVSANNSNSILFISVLSGLNSDINLVVSSSFKCNQGYLQAGFQCSPLTTCTSGQYYDTQKQTCYDCSTTLDYCSACTSSTTCTACSNPFLTLSKGQCKGTCPAGMYPTVSSTSFMCISCQQNCLQCSSSTVCTECYEPTFVWNTDKKQCESVCSGGQYYSSAQKKCIACEVTHCDTCYGAGKQCVQCASGYKLDSDTNEDDSCKKTAKKLGILVMLVLAICIIIL